MPLLIEGDFHIEYAKIVQIQKVILFIYLAELQYVTMLPQRYTEMFFIINEEFNSILKWTTQVYILT